MVPHTVMPRMIAVATSSPWEVFVKTATPAERERAWELAEA